KRSQARQSAPNFPPRPKAGQRSCVSETSLTRSCLRPTARAAIIESESAFHNDVGWSTASSPAIRAWLKRLALATEPSTPWKSGASAPRWQRSVLGFQPCTGPVGHLSCAPECGPKRAAPPLVFAVTLGHPYPGYVSRPRLVGRARGGGPCLRLRPV